MTDNKVSMEAFGKLQDSSHSVGNDFRPEIFEATIAENAEDHLSKLLLEWNYPWEGVVTDLKTGLKKSAYPTRNRLNRIACAISHYRLWAVCVKTDKPMLIMEHDAIFIQRLRYNNLLEDKYYNIIGINNPIGNTRKSHEFHKILQQSVDRENTGIIPVPTIDNFDIPQGLAGNSAYIIKPKGARMCIKAASEHGLWPNDALMCKQLIPHMGVTKAYYTNTQRVVSTTTGKITL
ncbi:glycosyltransferase family 25 protein [Candidatus Gracilibacteria bacterium]|nr:glycosyltransferase family 25 protein [Candidatus Gracilibacteria bacterium]